MRLSSFALTFAATAKAASAAQLLICSDSTTANYALNDTLQGYGSLFSYFPGVSSNKLIECIDGATILITTPP